MAINETKVSLLIPTLNAGKRWSELLGSINDQSIAIKEKIIIDSGSTDDTIGQSIAHGFDINVIDKGKFNHGKVRQDLVNLTSSSTEICIFLTQDAILASPDSIKNLLHSFEDPDVGIAYGRQLPHKNARSLETHLRLFNYPPQSEVLSIADVERKGFKVFFCSNSFAAYRKSALNAVGGFPFDSIMGEDAIVAAKLLERGFKKAYVADAMVYHSHSYSISEEFRRYFDTRVFHEQNKWLIDTYGKPTGEGLKYVKSEFRFIARTDPKILPKAFTAIWAKWLGYNLGKFYKNMPFFLLKSMSMHRFYWKDSHKNI